MEQNGIFLKNDYIKRGDPTILFPSPYNYIGNIHENIIWGRQLSNYNNFVKILANFNIQCTMIHSARWNGNLEKTTINDVPNRFSFILQTSDPNLIWHRKDQNGEGQSYNWIYYKNNKLKMTTFLDYNMDQLKAFLER